MTDCLACVPLNETRPPPLNVFHHSLPPSLPVGSPARPRNKQNHREDKTRSVISQMLMDSRLFSPLPPLLCTLLPPLSAQHHQFVNPPPPPSLSCNDITLSIHSSPVSPSALAELLELQETGHISSSVAKQVSQPQAARSYPTSTSSLRFSLDASGSTSDPNRPVPPT